MWLEMEPIRRHVLKTTKICVKMITSKIIIIIIITIIMIVFLKAQLKQFTTLIYKLLNVSGIQQ